MEIRTVSDFQSSLLRNSHSYIKNRIVNCLKSTLGYVNGEMVLRCHDDIGWGLDYGSLSRFGIAERSHKAYLNDYFRGRTGADARGELYNEDPVTGDRAILGIVRSLGGEQLLGLFNFSNEEKTAGALRSGGIWQDLLMGEDREITGISLPAQGFCWLKRRA